MKKIMVLFIVILVFIGCYLDPVTDEIKDKQSQQTDLTISFIFKWEENKGYEIGDFCWYGYENPQRLYPGTELIWKSIQADNINHQPNESPEWWILIP